MKTVALLLVLYFAVVPVQAELTPEQVAVIAMADSPQSRELATYYMKARAIPESNLFLLSGKGGDTLDRAAWDAEVRPAIRQWLSEDGREDKIRCAVTCWDVPLTIGPRAADAPVVVQRTRYLSLARAARVEQVNRMIGVLESLGKPEATTPAAPANPSAADASLQDIATSFDTAMRSARERVGDLGANADTQQAAVTFDRVFVSVLGNTAILRVMAENRGRNALKPEQETELSVVNARLQGIQQGLQSLTALPDSVSRDAQILNLLQTTDGLLGSIRWIDQQQELLRKNETAASFDSELSLVHWSEYPLFRWQPNLLYYGFGGAGGDSVLMVSRLTAPTLELAKGLVDKAIAAEKSGLAGKVYLDARGMSFDAEQSQPNSFEAYDQSVRDLAKLLKEQTTLDVTLDNEPEVFQPGAGPDAALYCGWYSLAKYIDAFEWNTGAVGYHMAGGEAATLTTPGNLAWCNAMLEDGITATLGPVFEPYPGSFPKPDDFFPLLLTGKLTLVEVYYRTNPLSSWAMVLVSDPLYNPFKNKPALDDDGLPERLR